MNKLNYLLLSIFSINITFGTSLVTFDIDGVEECGFVSVTGTWDSWSGWGATTDTDMQAEIDTGDHEFVILCVDTEIPDWWNNIWAASTIFNAPIDTDCWNENYEYPNYTFSIDDSGDDFTVAYCAGTCDVTCEGMVDPCDDIDCGDLTCIDGECVDDVQIDLPVDFEGLTVNYTMTDFGGNVSSLITDPYDFGNMVIEIIKTNQAETWAGTTIGTPAGFATNIPLSLSNSVMTVRVWSPQAGVPIRLKVEDSNDPTHTCETETSTTVSGWQILEFDFENQVPGTELLSIGLDYGWTYNMASIFFNFGTEGAGETYYFDDVQMCEACDGEIDPCDDIDCGDLTCIDGECVEVSMVNVTFQLDVTNVATDAEGVYLVGSNPLLEGPTGLLMTDEDGDDIWNLEVMLETGVYTYKFRNGFCDDWDICDASWEDSLEECGVGEWDDREIVVGDVDLDVGPFCFNSCDVGYCPDDIEFYPITFIVDMNYQDTDPSGAYVTGGNVYMEGPIGHLMDDSDGDDIWEVTVDLPPGTYTFKFRNGFCGNWDSCWQWQWEDFEGECGVGEWGDREITVVDEGFTYGSYCFDFCEEGECPVIVPINVTFQVEVDVDQMSDAMGYGVFMYGNFNGYDYLFNPLPLEYTGSNYTFSVTTTFTANDYILYKYTIGSGGDANPETDEGIAGCGSNFSGDCGVGGANYREQVIPYFPETFELDTFDDCPGNAIVTLSVDMSNELISGNGICIAGGTMPNGPEGTSMCDLNNDDIYSVSLSFPYDSHQTYKFINGCGETWENPGFETIDGDCVEGQWGDRFFDVLEDGQNVGPYFFGSCELSEPLNSQELPIPNEYALYPAYPNPFNPMTTITYSIPDPSIVTIRVYDILGNQVTELLDHFMSAGNHQVIWNANKQPTGIYFVRLSTEKSSQTQKIILTK